MKSIAKLTVALLALVATTAAAQTNNASITATASVQAPINVTGAVNLDFQNVFPGINKTVLASDPTAGRFDITGQASTLVNLAFTLPTNLVNGGNNLPIGTFTGLKNTANNQGTATAFAPAGGTTLTLSAGGLGFAWVGATVTPPVNLAAGTYTNTVQLTVTY